MYKEPNPDTEKEIIEKIAKHLVENNLADLAILFFSSFKSLSWIAGTYASILIEPFLPFYEKEGHILIKTLEKIENVELLIDRLEEFKIQKERMQHKDVPKKKIGYRDKFIGYIKKIVRI